MNRFQTIRMLGAPTQIAIAIAALAILLAGWHVFLMNRKLNEAHNMAWDARALVERHLIYDHHKDDVWLLEDASDADDRGPKSY